jgi:hypothetical protein
MKNPEQEELFDRPRQRWYAGYKMDCTQDVAILTGFVWMEIEVSVRPLCT